jgi:ABC-2 type transport system permease protein
MNEILALAVKDLRLLVRNRGALFFTAVWPLLVALLFGAIFSGNSDAGMGNIRIAVVDEDQTPESRGFAARLARANGLETIATTREEARTLVRQGKRQAYVLIARGYGERRSRMFYGETPQVEIGMDPSRKAEGAMLEGLLMQHAAEQMQETLGDPTLSQQMAQKALDDLKGSGETFAGRSQTERFLTELKSFLGSGATTSTGQKSGMTFQPLHVTSHPVTEQASGPQNAFAVTLPQGAIWGLVGCAAAFAIGFVAERTRGTLVRVQMAPLTRTQVLAGKATACFLTAAAVQVIVFVAGALLFNVRPHSLILLSVAVLCACAAFVGIMMLLAVLGKTEQAVSGSAWAALLLMSMIGGGMVPLFAMPRWMLTVSNASPVKWAIIALEGATWRGFSAAEMALPCGILFGVGLATFAIGARLFRTT